MKRKNLMSKAFTSKEDTSVGKYAAFLIIAMVFNIAALIFMKYYAFTENISEKTKEIFVWLFLGGAVLSGVFGILAWRESDSKGKKFFVILSLISAAVLFIAFYIISWVVSIILYWFKKEVFGGESGSQTEARTNGNGLIHLGGSYDFDPSLYRIHKNGSWIGEVSLGVLTYDRFITRGNQKLAQLGYDASTVNTKFKVYPLGTNHNDLDTAAGYSYELGTLDLTKSTKKNVEVLDKLFRY